MGKRKQEKIAKQKNDVENLISQYQKQLAEIGDKLSSLENIPDASQKILELLKLRGLVTRRRFQANLEGMTERHVRDDRIFRKSAYVFPEDKEQKEKQLREKNPSIADIEKDISSNAARIENTLDETVRNCHGNLAEVARSPFYPEAWKEHEPLRDLFAAAKAAREALGEDVPSPAASKKQAPTLRRN